MGILMEIEILKEPHVGYTVLNISGLRVCGGVFVYTCMDVLPAFLQRHHPGSPHLSRFPLLLSFIPPANSLPSTYHNLSYVSRYLPLYCLLLSAEYKLQKGGELFRFVLHYMEHTAYPTLGSQGIVVEYCRKNNHSVGIPGPYFILRSHPDF